MMDICSRHSLSFRTETRINIVRSFIARVAKMNLNEFKITLPMSCESVHGQTKLLVQRHPPDSSSFIKIKQMKGDSFRPKPARHTASECKETKMVCVQKGQYKT